MLRLLADILEHAKALAVSLEHAACSHAGWQVQRVHCGEAKSNRHAPQLFVSVEDEEQRDLVTIEQLQRDVAHRLHGRCNVQADRQVIDHIHSLPRTQSRLL